MRGAPVTPRGTTCGSQVAPKVLGVCLTLPHAFYGWCWGLGFQNPTPELGYCSETNSPKLLLLGRRGPGDTIHLFLRGVDLLRSVYACIWGPPTLRSRNHLLIPLLD